MYLRMCKAARDHVYYIVLIGRNDSYVIISGPAGKGGPQVVRRPACREPVAPPRFWCRLTSEHSDVYIAKKY